MDVLFLDIDGVMTSDKTFQDKGKLYAFSSECVDALNKILKSNKVKIILTSSWRSVFDVESQCRIFRENGVCQFPAGQTDEIKYAERGAEIRKYLDCHKVDNFIILDDMMIEGFDTHFIHINPATGLTDRDIEIANKILNT